MIYTHVLNRGGRDVRSPLDREQAHGSAYAGRIVRDRNAQRLFVQSFRYSMATNWWR